MLTKRDIVKRTQRAFAPLQGVARVLDYKNRVEISIVCEGKEVLKSASFRWDILRNEHQLDDVLAAIRDQIPPAAIMTL